MLKVDVGSIQQSRTYHTTWGAASAEQADQSRQKSRVSTEALIEITMIQHQFTTSIRASKDSEIQGILSIENHTES